MEKGVPRDIWPLPINKKIEGPKNATERRLEDEYRMAKDFTREGYITECVSYADPHGFGLKSLAGIPKEIDIFVDVIRNINEGAILIDSIEDNKNVNGKTTLTEKDKEPRREIRAAIAQKYGKAGTDFYENNKLQQGNISSALSMIENIDHVMHLSPQLLQRVKDFREKFDGPHGHIKFKGDKAKHAVRTGARYLFELNNEEKIALMPEYTELCEQALSEIFTKAESKPQGI